MEFPSKLIIVKSGGPIAILGNAYGPILSPFLVELSIIEQLILTHHIVFEVLPGNQFLELTLDNFNEDVGGGGGSVPNPTISPNPHTIGGHLAQRIYHEGGIHGSIRFYEGQFERLDPETQTWKAANTDDILTGSGVTQLEIGGIPAGVDLNGLSMDQVIDKLFNPPVRPTIALTVNPEQPLTEKGATISAITFDTLVTKGDRDIDVFVYMRNGTIITSPAVMQTATHNYIYNHTTPVSEDTTFKAVVRDGEKAVETEYTYRFALPKFIGDENQYNGMNPSTFSVLDKSIDLDMYIEKTFTITDRVVCVGIPATMTIDRVEDDSGFELSHLFTEHLVDFTRIDGVVEPYKIYRSNDPMTVEDFRFKFTLSNV